ncbi:gamma-glutamylcyclotransferase family protein [Vibrio hippocampi]|uniref:Gamma-glutamylcyclotransferase family protein n=1 Tax=Vibrio hippocampi TaxID=654686 RepID=A0ABN8DLU9_9VIBR|nr:gamma-glutamylcyclotransferase family protein [Vibrio hippocampi]CAH0528893.1 hypothetical protein VHP8226_02921 [Vibrio hippocampi]
MNTVFVYGSLKQGFSNDHLMAEAKYLGDGTTQSSDYHLVSLGSYPAALKHGRHPIVGELYQVDDNTFHHLDLLEEHPDFYCREWVAIEDSNGEKVAAWLYILVADFDGEIPSFASQQPLFWSEALQVAQKPLRHEERKRKSNAR